MSTAEQQTEKHQDTVDPLLECLVFLTAHYGRARSAQALVSGLAYDGHKMKPQLFAEAAERLGIRTKTVKKSKIKDIPEAVLPAVIVLKGEKASVLVSPDTVFDPSTGEKTKLETDALQEQFAGYVILTQAKPEFTNPDAADPEDTDKHWFWSLVNQNKSIFGMVLLGAVFINLFGLTSPLYIMNVYDRVIPNNAIETGWALAIGALVVFVFDLVMRSLRAYLLDLAGRRIDVIATRRIFDQVLNMRLTERPRSSGAFANMLRDFDAVRDFFTSATITALVDLPFTLFFLFIIYKLGGAIAFLLTGLLAAVFVIGLIIQVPLKSVVRKATRSAEAKHGMLVETIHGLETIKAIGADGAFRARYGALVGENAAYGQSSRMISGFGINSATFVQQIASVLVVLMGMYLVADGSLSIGGLIACVILSGRALAPIGQVANLLTRYHHASGALKTLDDIMSKPIERPADRNFLHRPDIEGKITLKNVGFEYPDVARKVLDGVSFTINPGEKVGLIGRVGSGKSTAARLMMGLYQPTEGTLLADDTDYRQIDPAELRGHFAYIAQDVVLFSGSVRDNICASKPSATEEEILAASKAAGVHEFVSSHPMGYDAPVGEHGEGLSGGQRQAIALARAILIDPKVLICDEPTNAMDTQAEAAFKSYMDQQTKDKTLILITHKFPMLDMVDRLILLDQGQLIMDGPRDKVIAALNSGELKVRAG